MLGKHAQIQQFPLWKNAVFYLIISDVSKSLQISSFIGESLTLPVSSCLGDPFIPERLRSENVTPARHT